MWCIGRNVYAVAGVEQIFFSFQGKQTAAFQNIENFFFGMGVSGSFGSKEGCKSNINPRILVLGKREGGSILDKLAESRNSSP